MTGPRSAPVVTVFGLGEAGSAIAQDLLSRGSTVHGYDPAHCPTPPGVERHPDPGSAVAASDIVLALTAADDAEEALRQALDAIPPGTLYADLSTSSPALQRRLCRVATEQGLSFADVALMSTVPGTGLATPQLVAGPGARAYAEVVARLGASATVVDDEAGAASLRKLLRSIVVKGLAALLHESLTAAEAVAMDAWLWDHLVEDLGRVDAAFLRRLVEGTPRHATRRRHEMEAAVDLLTDLGIEACMTPAVVESLRRFEVASEPEPSSEAAHPSGRGSPGRRGPDRAPRPDG